MSPAVSYFYAMLAISPLLASFYFLIFGDLRAHLNYHTKYPDSMVYDPDGRKIYRTIYFGDSLIDFSDRDFGFIGKEQAYLSGLFPKADFDAYSVGVSGNRVAQLLARMQRDVVAHKPDCVMVYFDSDASDPDPSDALSEATEHHYERNLRQLLTTLVQTVKCPQCVALAGPSLYGEFPCGSGLNKRDDIYDAYAAINARVGAQLAPNVTVFATRDLFCSKLREAGWGAHSGLFTFDGEHHSAAGVGVVSQLFQDFLAGRYSTCVNQAV